MPYVKNGLVAPLKREERKRLQDVIHMARKDNRIDDDECMRLCKLVENKSEA